MEKPTIEQTAWVFSHICDHLLEGGTFRYLIHNRLGYPPSAYQPLYEAGGMTISNALGNIYDLELTIRELKVDNSTETVQLKLKIEDLERTIEELKKGNSNG